MDTLIPRERDPKAIRHTVLVLIAIMIGGIFVAQAYVKLLKRQQTEFRPEYSKRLVKNLQLVRHDREAVSLGDLEGQVWLCAVVSVNQSETGELSRSAMKELAATFAESSDVKFLLATVDPEVETPDVLAAFAEENDLTLPNWWMVGAEPERLRKYLKNEMRFGEFPHLNEAGEWVFDTSVLVVDRNRHIRGHFDFDRAQKLAEGLTQKGDDVDVVGQLTAQLEKTVNYLLTNEQ